MKTYSDEFKASVVEYSVNHSNSAASDKYDVPLSTLGKWCTKQGKLGGGSKQVIHKNRKEVVLKTLCDAPSTLLTVASISVILNITNQGTVTKIMQRLAEEIELEKVHAKVNSPNHFHKMHGICLSRDGYAKIISKQ